MAFCALWSQFLREAMSKSGGLGCERRVACWRRSVSGKSMVNATVKIRKKDHGQWNRDSLYSFNFPWISKSTSVRSLTSSHRNDPLWISRADVVECCASNWSSRSSSWTIWSWSKSRTRALSVPNLRNISALLSEATKDEYALYPRNFQGLR